MRTIRQIPPDAIQTYSGWFNGSDDQERAAVSTGATDANEVVLSIESLVSEKRSRPKADAYLSAVQAIQMGERLIEAGRGAIARLELVRGFDASQDVKRNP